MGQNWRFFICHLFESSLSRRDYILKRKLEVTAHCSLEGNRFLLIGVDYSQVAIQTGQLRCNNLDGLHLLSLL